MKVPVFGVDGAKRSEISVAKAFKEPVRADLIKKAVLSEQSENRQAYGADPMAGKRTSAHYHGRRGIKHSMMNREMARMKRIHGTGFLHMRARFVPQATKGRKAHPPKAEKVWTKLINVKEWEKAFRSAIAATADNKLVKERGHIIEGVKHIPLIVDDKVEDINKSKDTLELLTKLGLEKELERTAETKERAGKGKARGRKRMVRKGPLLITAKGSPINKAGANILGFDVIPVDMLCVEDLAPGTQPGRLCIWTKSALECFEK
jgi:large subunit ribosomal protein L4e